MIRLIQVGADDPVSVRGTGRTRRLIEQAPEKSVFVAPNQTVQHEAQDMRSDMRRHDVRVVSREWIESDNWRGTTRFIVLDHTLRAHSDDQHILDAHNDRALR